MDGSPHPVVRTLHDAVDAHEASHAESDEQSAMASAQVEAAVKMVLPLVDEPSERGTLNGDSGSTA